MFIGEKYNNGCNYVVSVYYNNDKFLPKKEVIFPSINVMLILIKALYIINKGKNPFKLLHNFLKAQLMFDMCVGKIF